MPRQWYLWCALIAGIAVALALATPPLAPALAAPAPALTASAEPPTRTPATRTPASGPDVTPTAGPDTTPTAPPDEAGRPTIDLALRKEASPATVAPGEQVTFVLTVTCAGQGRAREVLIEDTLPAGLRLLTASASWGELTTSGNTVRVRIPVLYPGDQVTVQITAVVEPDAPAELVNRAEVTTVTDETDLTNNSDTATVRVAPPPATPTPGMTEAPPPTVAPTATPAPAPARLPATGRPPGSSPTWPTLALLGAALTSIGLAIRARTGRERPR